MQKSNHLFLQVHDVPHSSAPEFFPLVNCNTNMFSVWRTSSPAPNIPSSLYIQPSAHYHWKGFLVYDKTLGGLLFSSLVLLIYNYDYPHMALWGAFGTPHHHHHAFFYLERVCTHHHESRTRSTRLLGIFFIGKHADSRIDGFHKWMTPKSSLTKHIKPSHELPTNNTQFWHWGWGWRRNNHLWKLKYCCSCTRPDACFQNYHKPNPVIYFSPNFTYS